MVPTANNNTPTPEPTGDLEQLFRQRLGEAEVAPRMHLWDQIDHELLVQQNETYRRRLAWHRWVAAACILLFLGAGSWFTVRRTGNGTSQVAVADNHAAAAETLAAASPAPAAPVAGSLTADEQAADVESRMRAAIAEVAREAGRPGGLLATTTSPQQAVAVGERGLWAYSAARATSGAATGGQPGASSRATSSGELPTGSFFERLTASTPGSYSGTSTSAVSWLNALSGPSTARAGVVVARPDTSKMALLSAPAMLAAQAPARSKSQEPEIVVARPKRWRLMGAYAAAAYNPNMSFGSASTAGLQPSTVVYSARPGVADARAVNAYEQAAEEYRQNLRPGFAQRVAMTVSYAATKRWTLSAGLAAAEQRATSQTSYSFLDGKMPAPELPTASRGQNSLAPPRPVEYRTAQYRYRTAGVPVSVRYGSAKNGVSLYAKVGAAVNVLFNTRSELIGVPEATTTYSLSSVGSPYRKVQGSVNGGAGLRYKPAAAQWSLAVGPTAEAGLSTLNTNATQTSYQARPYAIGMEASVEFGGKTTILAR